MRWRLCNVSVDGWCHGKKATRRALGSNTLRTTELSGELVRPVGQATAGAPFPGRVVMLTCQFTEILGGAEKQCGALTEALRKRGVDALVVCGQVPGWSVASRERGVKRFWTFKPPQLAGRYLPASLLWAVQVFAWVTWHRRSIAILHCHQLRINAYIAALANLFFGIPTVMKLGIGGERNDFYIISQRKYALGRAGARFVIRHASAVIATASQIAADARAWRVPESRIFRIPNGVDFSHERFAETGESDPRLADFNHGIRIAFVGRLSEEKNVERALEAVLAIEPTRHVEFHVIGEGPLLQPLQRKVSANHEAKIKVVFHGRREDVFEVLAHVHFILMVSDSEGLSNALLEAAAVGVVPILSSASGNRDVVPFDDFPLFLQGRSRDELYQALTRALQMSGSEWADWSDRMAKHTREHFDLTTIADRYIELYETLRTADRAKAAGGSCG